MPRAKGTVLNSAGAAPRKPSGRDTPAMRQYAAFKAQHPGCVLFFRMGDFYEMFDDDAVAVAKALNLTLTERTEGVPMAGVPHHAAENYLRRLIDMGFRVAVCEQVQDPRDAKGVVDRAVARVVTPGTLVDESLLDDDAGSVVAAAAWLGPGEDARVALAGVELSTGAFWLSDRHANEAVDELARRGAAELLYCETADGATPPRVSRLLESLGLAGTPRPSWHFRDTEARERLLNHYQVTSLGGFGLEDDDPALPAAAAVLAYLQETQAGDPGVDADTANDAAQALARRSLAHIAPPKRDDPRGVLRLDATSLRSLEITQTVRSRAVEGSLLGVFTRGRTAPRTPMGKRTLREWLCAPPTDPDTIAARHDAVAALAEDDRLRRELRETLDGVSDVARIAARVGLWRATPRDLVALGRSLATIEPIIDLLTGPPAFTPHAGAIAEVRNALEPVGRRIVSSCVERPPAHLRDGGLVRDGVDAELDRARATKRKSAEWLSAYQQRIAKDHALPSLKVGFNKVFGYYIELPAGQASNAPDAFTRKQTLKNAERYITPELKEFEEDVLSADERAATRERAVFNGLCEEVQTHGPTIRRLGVSLAELDALTSFAEHAARMRWTRPRMTADPVLEITQGRHPVLEQTLAGDFVPNDLRLGAHEHPADDIPPGSLALITGPNMAGKSTYIRQVALITLLAHAGSFVPAEHARVGLTDRIFTRVGADDALHAGQSTFMVEMIETANILRNATPRSLVVLDEIGRGTSTLDGLSLAWAITEHLAGVANRHADAPRTLFATHYHELTDLADRHPGRVFNLHVAVKRWTPDQPSANRDASDEIVFLHRIEPGPASESFGVRVAKLAGVPASVVDRADTLLSELSVSHGQLAGDAAKTAPPTPSRHDTRQMALFKEYLPHPAVDRIRNTDLDTLSPMQAFELLRELRACIDAPE